jgi:hypothetical protein
MKMRRTGPGPAMQFDFCMALFALSCLTAFTLPDCKCFLQSFWIAESRQELSIDVIWAGKWGKTKKSLV